MYKEGKGVYSTGAYKDGTGAYNYKEGKAIGASRSDAQSCVILDPV